MLKLSQYDGTNTKRHCWVVRVAENSWFSCCSIRIRKENSCSVMFLQGNIFLKFFMRYIFHCFYLIMKTFEGRAHFASNSKPQTRTPPEAPQEEVSWAFPSATRCVCPTSCSKVWKSRPRTPGGRPGEKDQNARGRDSKYEKSGTTKSGFDEQNWRTCGNSSLQQRRCWKY